jgi:hypothetical protein
MLAMLDGLLIHLFRIFMKIDFNELAHIEKQAIPSNVTQHLETLNHVVNEGLHTLANLAPNIRDSSNMRRGRIGSAIECCITPSKSLYHAVEFTSQLVKNREQALTQQLVSLQQMLKEHIPTHETVLQQQLADATLSGDSKAVDKAVEGLQKLRQRTMEQGELESRTSAVKAILATLQQVQEIIYVIKSIIEPSLWLEQAKRLQTDYLQQREQIADFINLHHQIRACEWFGKSAMTVDYVSPLNGTLSLFEFDQEHHNQASGALKSLVFMD